MERSALYRRALAPIMILAGSIGTIAALAGYFLKIESARAFAVFWMSVAVFAIVGVLLLVRRQALKDAESFWSLPTRRVTSALMPPLFVGLFVGVMVIVFVDGGGGTAPGFHRPCCRSGAVAHSQRAELLRNLAG